MICALSVGLLLPLAVCVALPPVAHAEAAEV